MTRQEFIDNVTSWSELIDFCNEYGCDECSDVYDEYQMDETIDNGLVAKANECDGWRELYQYLHDVPSGYSYYQYNYDYDEWKGLDNDDFDDYKDEVLKWALNNDIFDEEEEYIDDEYDDIEEDDELEDEDISLGDLFSACSTDLKELEKNADMDSLGEIEIDMDDIPF